MKITLQFEPDVEHYAIRQMGFIDLGAVRLEASYSKVIPESELKGVGNVTGGLFGEVLNAKEIKRGLLEELVQWVASNGYSVFDSEYKMARAIGEGDKPYLAAWVVAK